LRQMPAQTKGRYFKYGMAVSPYDHLPPRSRAQRLAHDTAIRHR